jgi:hypothetical protein
MKLIMTEVWEGRTKGIWQDYAPGVNTSSFGSTSRLGSRVVASGGPMGIYVSIKVRFASDFSVSTVFTASAGVVRELVLCSASE